MWSMVALADDADCRVATEDYPALRQELRELRRVAGRPLHVAGDAHECEEALAALDANDPLLRLKLVEAPPGTAVANVEHSLERARRPCGAVLAPAPGGWALHEVGTCVDPRQDPDGDRHLLTMGSWQLAGASLRYNRELSPGFSVLADLGIEAFDPTSPLGRPVSWGWMAGFDANHDSLRGGYLGMRGGIERLGEAPGQVAQSTIAQGIVGHRFVGRGATLQLGVGVLVRVPSGEWIGDRGLGVHPMGELRLGLAR
jgi:hypothetical protein